ncbi:MAG TPA: sodium:calcium antiporter [Candidatus Paceibacterota bacterium]|nr:sodium:calcium antiporter [Candidatus Paceibacterota bacterium]
MLENLFIFTISIFLVLRGATLATKYSAKLAENFNIPKHTIGFIVIAFISILPETFISINSAIENSPEFGLGTLLGSNVADLTLIFGILIIYAKRGIKIKSRILKNVELYPFFLLLPIILGLNGYYSRAEGLVLIISGIIFYYLIFKKNVDTSNIPPNTNDKKIKNFLFLIFAMSLLLIGSHFTVTSATELALSLKIAPILIGMLIVGLGTTMPEFFFSLKALRKKEDDLAIGDILGSVLADATIVVGVLATIDPFYFPVKIIYVTGTFMVIFSIVLIRFMRTERVISKKEGYLLLLFWVIYAIVEFIVNSF